jgi:hypothetical protein
MTGIDPRVQIEGLKELQAYNERLMAGLRGPFLNKAVRDTTLGAHKYAKSITHVVTGTLRASHRMEIVSARQQGIISIDRSARNPYNGGMPYEYGVYEHDRGDDHAFYARTVSEYGDTALRSGVEILMGSVRNA